MMTVVEPIEITPSLLIESNLPVDDYPEYSGATTYSQGDRVMIAAERKIYEYVSETSGSGTSPLADTDPPKWFEVGFVNRWKAFDKVVGSASEGSYAFDPLNYAVEEDDTYTEGVAFKIRTETTSDTIALFNVRGLHVDVLVRTDLGLEFQERVNTGNSLEESNWYAYFFQPMYRRDRLLITNLPETPVKDIYITVVQPTGSLDPAVGEIVIGRSVPIGRALYGTSLDFLDFSTKERDIFGNFQIVERDYADELEVDLSVMNDQIFFIRQLLATLRAKPAVWIPSECIDGTTVYGYFSNFSVTVSGPERSRATLRIEGLI